MTPPRCIHKKMVFYVTVRAVNRSFRFVPKKKIRESIKHAISTVLQKYRDQGLIRLHEFEFMSNHYHLLGTDLGACLPDFLGELNSLISRQLNAIRGIRGTNFEDAVSIIEVVDADSIVGLAVYTLANPVKANLVEKARHWKGPSSVRMQYGVPEQVHRPKLGLWTGRPKHVERSASKRSRRAQYAKRLKTPEVAEIVLDRPPVLKHLSDEQLRAHIMELLAAKERHYAELRKQMGIGVLGWAKVVAQHFLSIPGSEELFGRVPNFTATDRWDRIAAARVREAFIAAYRKALALYRGGDTKVAFPEGTWLMRRRFKVRCEPLAA